MHSTQVNELNRGSPPDFRVLMRIHSYTNDLDIELTKRLLELGKGDPRVVNSYYDQDEGIAGWEFANGPKLGADQIEWQKTAFLNASLWLRDKSPSLFQQFRESGNKVDICIAWYRGPIPSGLIKELARLDLELYFIT